MTPEVLTDLEKSIIGGILLDPKILAELPSLEPEHFVHCEAQHAFAAIRNLDAQSRPIDPMTIYAEIDRRGMPNAVSPEFIAECVIKVPTSKNACEYARDVMDASLRRRVGTQIGNVLQALSRDQTLSGADALSMALECLSGLDAEQHDDAQPIGEMVRRRVKELEALADARANGADGLTGFYTGSDSLDRLIGGWQPGIVSLVAARPGMGKSSLGLATADACTEKLIGVHLFSLEDSWHAYTDRALARNSKVPAEEIRSTKLTVDGMRKLSPAITRLRQRKGWLVDNRSGISADEIVRSVRRHTRDNGTRVVIVDYVQLVKRPRHHSTHEELTHIVETLADAAKHDGMAYVVMSQLNRGVEQRQDKRPQLSDLRESGSLEERAKCVVAIYRGAYYGQGAKEGVDYEQGEPKPSDHDFERQVQLLILKNSNGATGRVFATWDGPTLRLD